MKRWLLVLQGQAAGRVLLFGEAWADAAIVTGRARALKKTDWPLKTPPIEYLEKEPWGEHARLAAGLINAGVF